VHEKELEASREVTSLVSVESVARMGVAELEACLAQALNPQVPLEVLETVLERLRNPEVARRRPEAGALSGFALNQA
jgi:hypothetical protein